MLCLSDCLCLSFQLQESLQLTSSQDCSTGEQTPGDLWSCPSLERFVIDSGALESSEVPFAAVPVPPAELGSVPQPAQGTARALLGRAVFAPGLGTLWGGTAPFCHLPEAGSAAIPVLADPAGSVGAACGSTRVGPWLGTVCVQVRSTDWESSPCS